MNQIYIQSLYPAPKAIRDQEERSLLTNSEDGTQQLIGQALD